MEKRRKIKKKGGTPLFYILYSLYFLLVLKLPALLGQELALPLFFQQFSWGRGLLC